jgi:hypothetical protein
MDHQLIVFLVFGIIAVANWLLRKGASKDSGDTGSPPVVPQRAYPSRPVQSGQSEEERMRKFMEALGVPTVVEPPRKIVRPVQPPPLVVPPLVSRESPKPPFVPKVAASPPPVAQPAREISTWESAPAAPKAMEIAVDPLSAAIGDAGSVSPIPGIPQGAVAAPSNTVDIQTLLKSASSLRAAVLLREILGPPRGLQPFAGAGSLL